MPDALARDPDRERALHLAHGDTPAARQLSDLALQRALPGPVHLPPGRSLITELLEELADGLNYATWAALTGELSDDDTTKICEHIIAARSIIS